MTTAAPTGPGPLTGTGLTTIENAVETALTQFVEGDPYRITRRLDSLEKFHCGFTAMRRCLRRALQGSWKAAKHFRPAKGTAVRHHRGSSGRIPFSAYFGPGIDFRELAGTGGSLQQETEELQKLERRIRTCIQRNVPVACGLTLKQLAAAVEKGAEDFIFKRLRLQRDRTTGCTFYCADDRTCQACTFAPTVDEQRTFRRGLGQVAFGINLQSLLLLDVGVRDGDDGVDVASSSSFSERNRASGQKKWETTIPETLHRLEILLQETVEREQRNQAQKAKTGGGSAASSRQQEQKKQDVLTKAESALQSLRLVRTVRFDPEAERTVLEVQRARIQEAFERTVDFLTSGLLRSVYSAVLEDLEGRCEASRMQEAGFKTEAMDAYIQDFVIPTMERRL
jgi:hypothetical protein